MKLTLVATPIGNDEDITIRALNALKKNKIIVCEEFKTLRRRLSIWGIKPQEKELHQLNEHTSDEEVFELLNLCKKHDVLLVTDCGTPSFFDPGFKLVEACRKSDIEVESLPGVSSLTALFPFLKFQTEHFEVLGFPPREQEKRSAFFKKLKDIKSPVLILDTPYRLKKTIDELLRNAPDQDCVFGINLTCSNERIAYGKPKDILNQTSDLNKENFVCMVYPKK